MNRTELEKRFTAMLVNLDQYRAYSNLTLHYLMHSKDFKLRTEDEAQKVLKELKEGNPREWISKVFTEGLDMPPGLYHASCRWQAFLEVNEWV